MAERTGLFAWLQDNARILLSIALVLFLLFAVYSYSKRTSIDNQTALESDGVEFTTDKTDGLPLDPTVIGEVDEADQADVMADNTNDSLVITENDTDDAAHVGGNNVAPTTGAQTVEKKDGHITVTATAGNGMTHLARKAASEYNASNSVSLTDAEKIYVENYLVRHTAAQAIHPGTAVSFSNQSIADAISAAKNMSPAMKIYFERCAVNVHF